MIGVRLGCSLRSGRHSKGRLYSRCMGPCTPWRSLARSLAAAECCSEPRVAKTKPQTGDFTRDNKLGTYSLGTYS